MFYAERNCAFAILLAAVPCAAFAAESYDNCSGYIDSLPAIITSSGTWCLRKDLSTPIATGAAITVASNNVVVDCNDFKIGGLAAGPATKAAGVRAFDRQNVTVRHCNVRGFIYGVALGGAGHVVEDNRFDGNTSYGVMVQGDGSIVQRNLIRDTGGAHDYQGDMITGIGTWGTSDVVDNVISGVAPEGSYGFVAGITTQENFGGSIKGNRMRGLVGDPAFEYSTVGISAADATVFIRNNDIMGDGHGLGLTCETSSSRAVGNIIHGFETGILGCGDAGGNDVTP